MYYFWAALYFKSLPLNDQVILGRIPLLFTTSLGVTSAGKVAIKLPRCIMVSQPTHPLKRTPKISNKNPSVGVPRVQVHGDPGPHTGWFYQKPWIFAVYEGWNPAQLYRDYSKPWNKDPILTNQDSMECHVWDFLITAHLVAKMVVQ